LREATRQKLEAFIRSERNRDWLALALGAALVGLAGLYFLTNSLPLAQRPVSGVVRWAVWKIDPETGRHYPDFQVMLTGGQLVRAYTLERDLPSVGASVELSQETWAFGPTSYSWNPTRGQLGKP
jgi:hypothetical protein